jgi:hypothetical protein
MSPVDKPTSRQVYDIALSPYPEDKSVDSSLEYLRSLPPEELQKLRDRVKRFEKLMEEYGIDLTKADDEEIKRAYPNYDQYMGIPGQHNLQKWLSAVRNIHVGEKSGLDLVQAVRQATSGWNPMETYDFLNWMRFYQEGAHLKYKTAQLWYENGQPGYFLQIKPDPAKPEEPTIDHHAVQETRDSADRQEEKKKIIEKQRQKIIGRLDSAEKLLRSPEGQMFAGTEMESLMEAIFNLKKKVQLVNKLSVSTRLYEDMIVREGNVLYKRGFVKAAEVLYSVAQANNPPPPGIGQPGPIEVLPQPVPPDDPSGAGHPGLPGTLPSLGPGMPQAPKSPPSTSENQPVNPKMRSGPEPTAGMQEPTIIPQDEPKSQAITEFLDGIETGNKTTTEELKVEDTLEVEDDQLMVSEAQMAAPPVAEDVPMTTTPRRPKPAAPPPSPEEEPLNVTEDTPPANEAGVENAAAPAKDFDRIIDSALANVSENDVIAKLEDIAKIFKTREIPRQLALVDMMLDSLGLASYFPTLSEAINKSLESNNYVSTRLEDIISRLRGGVAGKNIDLKGDQAPRAGSTAKNLQEQDNKEQARKKMRKEQEEAELGVPGKETPQVDVGGDLGGPAAPAAPPAAPAPGTVPPLG